MAKKHGKNSKKTTRRATFAIWRLFADLKNPKRALSKMNLTIDGGKHVLAMILNQELFEWIIKKLLNSPFVLYEEL